VAPHTFGLVVVMVRISNEILASNSIKPDGLPSHLRNLA
jgi:hypothetical protein